MPDEGQRTAADYSVSAVSITQLEVRAGDTQRVLEKINPSKGEKPEGMHSDRLKPLTGRLS